MISRLCSLMVFICRPNPSDTRRALKQPAASKAIWILREQIRVSGVQCSWLVDKTAYPSGHHDPVVPPDAFLSNHLAVDAEAQEEAGKGDQHTADDEQPRPSVVLHDGVSVKDVFWRCIGRTSQTRTGGVVRRNRQYRVPVSGTQRCWVLLKLWLWCRGHFGTRRWLLKRPLLLLLARILVHPRGWTCC